jgi:hypothetical protein
MGASSSATVGERVIPPFEATHIPDLGNLWLGPLSSAVYLSRLKEKGITHIVTVGDFPGLPKLRQLKRFIIPVDDWPSSNLLSELKDVIPFIKAGLAKGGVLVHCAAGVSRSASIVILTLMHEKHIPAETAIKIVQGYRSVVWPNDGFRRQIALFEEKFNYIPPTEPLDKSLWLPSREEQLGRFERAPKLSTNTPKKSHVCDACGQIFDLEDSLYRHVLEAHPRTLGSEAGQEQPPQSEKAESGPQASSTGDAEQLPQPATVSKGDAEPTPPQQVPTMMLDQISKGDAEPSNAVTA